MALSFSQKVYAIVRNIPKGTTLSYVEVARKAGSPGASRVVGSLMKKNYDPLIPCHRVIKSSGAAGQYNRGGEKAKRTLLAQEGVILHK